MEHLCNENNIVRPYENLDYDQSFKNLQIYSEYMNIK